MNQHFFDTLTLDVGGTQAAIIESAEKARINLRILGRGHLGVSLDETCTEATVMRLFDVFLGVDHGLRIADLDAQALPEGIPGRWSGVRRCSPIRCSICTTAKPRCCATSSSWRTRTWR